ncbi:MAG: hypothetical protein A2312_02410 [Candidatus Staskawiczbacteria bacterium RIFOXYB2_FULL_32_9]|uniref:Uncharacterized protein n=1 Tax=Candidatus Staskawiczbacteria bacterium RIFOXYD1_FULL_32_13 TaxID=1802234 RepID=A0A1G2JML2_9BACT|nr:MAG: hypothetical protein UR22_C0004G0041 [Parcubacteria group bacterium GW2011_GWC2_32_10]OGZ78637.1 MAG: hypothetical protein A2256_03870 [Candidatus Staskawiczbacteria bacterium RIFOXYA2_FULL_32_7]OGZ79316.1 MAG: hypothetical protein A2360_01335 [Candidatus Staskawiczbacteria bacterium RIFOXYB1_FULL_32_11]OGZ80981.1 MAG: hypothetical protein A2312_02410 [Candidatus Staskawiczbacteria bacterium RIFOXYB2_FULL_32_9]OGZ88058.1 MAG: hypothetical protein A2463_00420 [Candidatus Staskawiczbacter
MAIVFVSPKKKQILFFSLIAGFFLLLLLTIILFVFLMKPEAMPAEKVFKKPNINIDFSILDSERLKELNQLEAIEYVFTYNAMSELDKIVSGKITAVSESAAVIKLEEIKLSSIELKRESLGRENPFNIYYQQVIAPPLKK